MQFGVRIKRLAVYGGHAKSYVVWEQTYYQTRKIHEREIDQCLIHTVMLPLPIKSMQTVFWDAGSIYWWIDPCISALPPVYCLDITSLWWQWKNYGISRPSVCLSETVPTTGRKLWRLKISLYWSFRTLKRQGENAWMF